MGVVKYQSAQSGETVRAGLGAICGQSVVKMLTTSFRRIRLQLRECCWLTHLFREELFGRLTEHSQ